MRVGHHLLELGEAPQPAAVLGRAGAAAGDAAWVEDALHGRPGLLDDHVMMPAVAEVIPVPEAFDAIPHQVGEGDAVYGQRRIGVNPDVIVGDAVLEPVDVERV